MPKQNKRNSYLILLPAIRDIKLRPCLSKFPYETHLFIYSKYKKNCRCLRHLQSQSSDNNDNYFKLTIY